MSIGRRSALVTASIITLLGACSDDDSPTAPDVADVPELNEHAPVPGVPTASLAANGKIAFRSDRVHFTNWEIFVMNADGAAQTRVTNSSGADGEPAWSPDGTELAFIREANFSPDIFLVTFGDTAATNLTNTANVWDWHAAWKPDGSSLAFTRIDGSNWGVYTMSATNGSGQTRITSQLAHEFTPSWSPDGSKLAVTCRAGGAPEGSKDICVMNADGSGVVNLIPLAGQEDFDPAWSPDGSKIAFTSNRDGGNSNYEIYVMNADGTNHRRLTVSPATAPAWDHEPTWSPDGTRIAFSSARDGNYEIYVMNEDGTGQTNLTNNPGNDDQPSWQPLGSAPPPPPPPPPPANESPNGAITSPAANVTIQAGQSVSFAGSGTDSDGTVATYSWSFPGGSPASSTAQNPGNVTYGTAGTYTVTLTVTDNAGTSDPTPATRTVTVQGAPEPLPPPPPPADVTVVVTSKAFTPKMATGAQGGTVRWSFQGPGAHDVTDKSGMALFGSGSKAPGTTYSFAFQAAGTYAYYCSLHGNRHSGKVRVPVQVSPARGTAATAFTVTWASAAAPSGYAYDIQIQRPGTTGFVSWRTGQTAGSATFTPDRGAGTYHFRARLRKASNGRASEYSPTVSITVN